MDYQGDYSEGLIDACTFYGIKARQLISDKETEARVLAKADAEKAKLKTASDKAEAHTAK